MDIYFGTRGPDAKGIYHTVLDKDSGKLSKASLVAEIATAHFLALHPNKNILYTIAQHDTEPCVAAYRIGEKGKLSLINKAVLGKEKGSAHLEVHPSGKLLVTTQYFTGTIAVFPLSTDGSVGPRAQLIERKGGSGVVASKQNQARPHFVAFSPDAKYAAIPDLGQDKIVFYEVSTADSSLKFHSSVDSVPGSGPRHMRFSPDGKLIYLQDEITVSVTSFSYDSAKGTAELLSTTPALSESAKAKELYASGSEILVHPTGRFVYSGNRGHDTVTAYQADPQSGRLDVIEVEPIRGSMPRHINLDSSGQWLLAAGQDSSTVSVFEIDQESGELTFQRQSIIKVPNPTCVIFRE
ncbi:MAG: lactonase family protein [Opitutaceae bacterium]|nr:lactonase family protein [Opitutaceae bacterium]